MSADRRVYLKMTGAEQALEMLLSRAGELPVLPAESIPTTQASGRVTAAPIYACTSAPTFPAAAMDGYAVVSALTFGASEAQPVSLCVPQEAEPADTGDALPEGKDAVYKIEDVHEEQGSITVLAAAWPGQHVRLVGEEVTAGELLVTSGEWIGPQHIGLLLAAQVWSVPVRRRPVVTLIPTGTECVPAGDEPGDGQFVEYNGPMLAAALTEWGAEPQLLAPVEDQPDALADAIVGATEDSDLVAVIAGSSAGREDFVPHVISELGELLVHGVRMMPGKPLALGWIADTPVIGLPGYCVAAWIALDNYARPLICHLLGVAVPERPRVQARVQRKLPSSAGMREVIRVALCDSGGDEKPIAVPLPRASGSITSLARAHGLLAIEAGSEGLDAGSEADVELLVSLEEIQRSIVTIGSHDLALAVLAERLAQRRPPLALLSLSTGSAEGLAALGRGEGFMAGTHLLDPATQQYNIAYIQRWLRELPLILVNLTFRQVGLLVSPGNPKAISDVGDVARDDVTLINRQPGSGTRVLLDFLLQQRSIQPQAVRGYEREAYTHTMVAEAIRQGSADAGLGILAAARVFGLDFVPVTEERYDLAIPKVFLDLDKVAAVLQLLRDPSFQSEVTQLGGYSLRSTGEAVHEQ